MTLLLLFFSFLGFFGLRRVHISLATLKCLRNAYEVEPGGGQARDSFLKVSSLLSLLGIPTQILLLSLHTYTLRTAYLTRTYTRPLSSAIFIFVDKFAGLRGIF